jgi:hypothetical protein
MEIKRSAFEEKVIQYLVSEWMVDPMDYPQNIQDRVFCTIHLMNGKGSVPATAGKIAMEVLPI